MRCGDGRGNRYACILASRTLVTVPGLLCLAFFAVQTLEDMRRQKLAASILAKHWRLVGLRLLRRTLRRRYYRNQRRAKEAAAAAAKLPLSKQRSAPYLGAPGGAMVTLPPNKRQPSTTSVASAAPAQQPAVLTSQGSKLVDKDSQPSTAPVPAVSLPVSKLPTPALTISTAAAVSSSGTAPGPSNVEKSPVIDPKSSSLSAATLSVPPAVATAAAVKSHVSVPQEVPNTAGVPTTAAAGPKPSNSGGGGLLPASASAKNLFEAADAMFFKDKPAQTTVTPITGVPQPLGVAFKVGAGMNGALLSR